MSEGIAEALCALDICEIDVQGDDGRCRNNNAEKYLNLGVERILEIPSENEEIGVEIDRKQYHKYGNYDLCCRGE